MLYGLIDGPRQVRSDTVKALYSFLIAAVSNYYWFTEQKETKPWRWQRNFLHTFRQPFTGIEEIKIWISCE